METIINESLAELTGIMFGDGCLSRSGGKYLVYICGHKIDDFEYHSKIIKTLFVKIFKKPTNVCFKRNENTIFIRFSDKNIFETFKSIGVPVGKKYEYLVIPDKFEDLNLFMAFLRGLFDTDGCIILSKQHRTIHYYPRIEITSKSENFLISILKRLQNEGFYGSVSNKGGSYRLEFPGIKNLMLWTKIIGVSNPKHVEKFERILKIQKLENYIND